MSQSGKKGRRSRKRLTDQEILEWFLQRFTVQQHSLNGERKGFWKATLSGAFLGGPFLTFLPFITWFELIPSWYFGILIGLNAVLLVIWATYFYLASKNLELISHQREKWVHFIGMGAPLGPSWMGVYGSLMALLASIGCLVRIPGAPWWMVVLIYGASGVGLWLGRKAILRAIVEGPEVHPWFWPIRLFFAISLGFWIFIGAVMRIVLRRIEEVNVSVGLVLLAIMMFGLSILLLGTAMVGWMISYLHYQKWRGQGS